MNSKPVKQLFDGRLITNLTPRIDDDKLRELVTHFKSDTKASVKNHLKLFMVSPTVFNFRYVIDFKCINSPEDYEAYESKSDNVPEILEHIDQAVRNALLSSILINSLILIQGKEEIQIQYHGAWVYPVTVVNS